MTSAHSTKNTSIRTRKIRGEDSLLSSISISEREEGPEAMCHPLRKAARGRQYGTAGERKKIERPDRGKDCGNFPLKPALVCGVFWTGYLSTRLFGILHDGSVSLGVGGDRRFALDPDGRRLGGAAANWQFRMGRHHLDL